MARRRVEIRKIDDKARRQVTFTKRRQGLFKKAEELHSKCGADVAVIAFSMAGNAYAFGDPSVKSVVDRYCQAQAPDAAAVFPRQSSAAERKVGEILERVIETKGGRRIWDLEIENLGFSEIGELQNAMEEMKKKIGIQQRMLMEEESSAATNPPDPDPDPDPNPNPNK